MSDPTPSDDVKKPVNEETTVLVPLSSEPSVAFAAAPKRRCARALAWLVLALVVVLAAAGGWGYQQWQTASTQWQAASAQNHAALAAAQAQAQRAGDAAAANSAALARLQTDQTRLAQQVQGMEHTLEDLSLSAGEDHPAVLLGEVDHLVGMAEQTLRLGGNVSTALLALESAQQRLQRDAALPDVQASLQADIERLRAVPVVDVAGLSARLDTVSKLLAQAPVFDPVGQAEQDAAPATPEEAAPVPAPASWWQRAWQQTQTWSRAAWRALAQDVRGLVQVRRIDAAAAILLPPDQVALLRANLQTRVVAARLALLLREPTLWAAELAAIEEGLNAHFDAHAAPVVEAQTLLRSLQATPIRVDLPGVSASVRAVQAQRDLGARAPQTPASQPSPSASAAQPDAPAPGATPGASESERG